MKFKIVRSKFLDVLKNVQNVVAGKGSLPIIQNVMIECAGGKLKATTTDLDLSAVSEIDCNIEEDGATTLPVKLLFALITKADEGEVEISVGSDDKGVINASSARYRIEGKNAIDFPKLNLEEAICEYKIQRAVLFDMLRKTSYAASQDDTRRTLKGVLMRFKDAKLTMVATDGRRLAMVEQEVEFPQNYEKDIVLPFKAVAELQRILPGAGEVIVKIHNGRASFEIGDVRIITKLIDDVYPDYTRVIPVNCDNKISIDRELLLNALERASVMTMDEAHSTRLTFDGNMLKVNSVAAEVGEVKDKVPIKYVGEKIEIVFNPQYVMDCLKAIDDDEITFHLNDGHSPAIIRCSIPFVYVIMPLRIN